MKMSSLDMTAWTLTVLAGLNWGAVALNFNLVELVFGSAPQLVQIVYVLMGVAAVYSLMKMKSAKK